MILSFLQIYMISRMIKENMLEPLDKSNIPNFANIMDKFKSSNVIPAQVFRAVYMGNGRNYL